MMLTEWCNEGGFSTWKHSCGKRQTFADPSWHCGLGRGCHQTL